MIYIEAFKTENIEFDGAWIFSNNERAFLLSRIGTSIILDNILIEQILRKNISDELAFKLVSHGLARVNNSPSPKRTDIVLPKFFIIDLTQRCNLACIYCFRHIKTTASISNSEINSICNYIYKYCEKYSIKQFTIQPWGGEPLLELEKIINIHDFFYKKNMYPKITIETNATLITEDKASILYANKIAVGVSIDGDKIIHDFQRPFISKKGSFNEVLKGIDNLRKAGYKTFGTISVITNKSIERIGDIIRYMIKELNINNLKFNIVRISSESDLAVTINKIEPFIEELFRTVISLTNEGFQVSEGNIVERIYNLLVRHERNICKSKGCMGGYKMVSFNRNGDIFPCELTDYDDEKIGSISQGDLLNIIKSASKQHKYFRDYRISECNNCPWWYYCRGGCHTSIKHNRNSYWGVDEIECRINKKMYPIIIDIILNQPHLIEKLTCGKIIII